MANPAKSFVTSFTDIVLYYKDKKLSFTNNIFYSFQLNMTLKTIKTYYLDAHLMYPELTFIHQLFYKFNMISTCI